LPGGIFHPYPTTHPGIASAPKGRRGGSVTISTTVAGFLIVNPRSGAAQPDVVQLTAEARARGVDVHVLGTGDDLVAIARAADAEALGMAGGDGSLAAVAAVALERDLPLVCVPYGTRNHFARDLGLDPDDPIAALDAFAEGNERRIDVGRVGERLFLNNVSLGLYARLVHRREHHRRRRDALARLRALWLVARQRRPITLALDGKPLKARILLVSNNRYELDVFSLGERPRLDEGSLYLYVAGGLLPRHWDGPTVRRDLTIDGPGGTLTAAIDGEPVKLELPARFRIEPQALRLLVPQPRPA
jgi:diacylglycerol kinase family enzyme